MFCYKIKGGCSDEWMEKEEGKEAYHEDVRVGGEGNKGKKGGH